MSSVVYSLPHSMRPDYDPIQEECALAFNTDLQTCKIWMDKFLNNDINRAANQYDFIIFCMIFRSKNYSMIFMPPPPKVVPEASCFRVVRPYVRTSVPFDRYHNISRTI